MRVVPARGTGDGCGSCSPATAGTRRPSAVHRPAAQARRSAVRRRDPRVRRHASPPDVRRGLRGPRRVRDGQGRDCHWRDTPTSRTAIASRSTSSSRTSCRSSARSTIAFRAGAWATALAAAGITSEGAPTATADRCASRSAARSPRSDEAAGGQAVRRDRRARHAPPRDHVGRAEGVVAGGLHREGHDRARRRGRSRRAVRRAGIPSDAYALLTDEQPADYWYVLPVTIALAADRAAVRVGARPRGQARSAADARVSFTRGGDRPTGPRERRRAPADDAAACRRRAGQRGRPGDADDGAVDGGAASRGRSACDAAGLALPEGREIARGGMGRVVEATDTVLGRTVALKEALSHDPEALRRFERETRITARLEHPSIVPVHDAGLRRRRRAVLRDAQGRRAARSSSSSPRRHARRAARALAAHRRRGACGRARARARRRPPRHQAVEHPGRRARRDGRDRLGPREGDRRGRRARARAVAAPIDADDAIKTRAGIVFGTPGFMAPEQLRGEPVDERCDVYALGATLYHLLARRPPHHARRRRDDARRGRPRRRAARELVAGRAARALDDHRQGARVRCPRALPGRRRARRGPPALPHRSPVSAHHYTAKEKLLRYVRKNRALVTVAAGATLAILVGGTIAIKRVVDEREPPTRPRTSRASSSGSPRPRSRR